MAETWRGGGRIRIRGVCVEEVDWGEWKDTERLYTIEDIAAIGETLTTGRKTSLEVEAWGLVYRSSWSLEPPSEYFERGRYLWFYPMSQDRYTLRVEAEPLRTALVVQLAWLEEHGPDQPSFHDELRRARRWLPSVTQR